MSENDSPDKEQQLISSLQLIDPMLQFLTKATNSSTVSFASLRGIIPKEKHFLLQHVKELDRLGVLMLEYPKDYENDDKILHILNQSADSTDDELKRIMIGFPLPIHLNDTNKNKVTEQLHGSTKAAGKRRLAYLKRTLKKVKRTPDAVIEIEEMPTLESSTKRGLNPSLLDGMVYSEEYKQYSVKNQHESSAIADDNSCDHDAKKALDQLEAFFGTKQKHNVKDKQTFCLPKQAAFAGSRNARSSTYSFLPKEICDLVPKSLQDMLALKISQDDESAKGEEAAVSTGGRRKLYKHQADAIKAIFNGHHTLICTGTGSGKSLCYLIPVLSDLINSRIDNNDRFSIETSQADSTAIIIFPTKALAQDQVTKLKDLILNFPEPNERIRLGILDGDTPHSQRIEIAEKCNLIMTNPDTLHAAILPGWKTLYKNLLARLHFVVIDELHTYEGAFGSHVSLVISRLLRVARISNLLSTDISDRKIQFIGCSATIGHPEDHFRLLCPISKDDQVTVLSPEQDTSPCAAKYYFVWNPPMVDHNGNEIGVSASMINHHQSSSQKKTISKHKKHGKKSDKDFKDRMRKLQKITDNITEEREDNVFNKRRHPADETARLLAHAIQNGIRCIAFCKTRMLAEWVYEKSVAFLKIFECNDYQSKVEIYRGGYSASVRRNIEKRLFHNELLGVVGTSALELGIDIGGIDLTLHCGYPGSLASLLQQAGRAGRGANHSQPSFAIMVCFNSPCEQHIWKYPKRLMGRGLLSPPCIPLNQGLVEGHLLCAADEFPLCGSASIEYPLLGKDVKDESVNKAIPDCDLFGGKLLYEESIENLFDRGLIRKEKIQENFSMPMYSKHPCVDRPTLAISLRSIEPITYTIVDLSHPTQGGNIDGIHDPNAIMDTIPYSRVFYHAFPGAIIMHRGKRYKIHTMNYPPCAVASSRLNSSTLCAFAKPSNDRFTTRALSTTLITVVRQIQSVDLDQATIQKKQVNYSSFEPGLGFGSLAGSGVVSIKKTVHGYKKLSLVNRTEISRSELSLPPMEYDTNAIWIDCEAQILSDVMTDFDAGVHALSHAILAVAPLFVPCTPSDLDCDHSRFGCTRVLLFDSRPGGTGTSSQLWSHFFRPNGVVEAAIDLLTECPLACDDGKYQGGCPGCLQSVPCVNFHEHMSRKAGLVLAKRMLGRIKMTQAFQYFKSDTNEMTPRRNARRKALQNASDLASAKKRGIVVGRPSWPGDIEHGTCVEPIDALNIDDQTPSNKLGVTSSQGGFIK